MTAAARVLVVFAVLPLAANLILTSSRLLPDVPRGYGSRHHYAVQPAMRRMVLLRGGGESVMMGSSGSGAILSRCAGAVGGLPASVTLALTIVLEVIATTCMKFAAQGSAWWYAGVALGYALCFTLFPFALRKIPLSIAYATWSGVGTAATVMIGALAFGEPLTPLKGLWILMVIVGIVGLNL